MILPNAMLVTLVPGLSAGQLGAPGVGGSAKNPASSTNGSPQTHLTKAARKSTGQALFSKPITMQEKASSLPPISPPTDDAGLKPLEDETAYDTAFHGEEMVQVVDDAVGLGQMSNTLSMGGPLQGQSEEMGAGLGGTGWGSRESGSGSVGSLDTLAKFLIQVRQVIERHKQYPRRARLEGLEGTTQLRFRILPTGEPTEIQVMQSSQSAVLDEEAVAAVKRVVRFPQPPVKSPLGILIRLPFVFHLEEGR